MSSWDWLAGLFEGEGSIHRHQTTTYLQIGMTDRDVLERVKNEFGGNLHGPIEQLGRGRKPMWRWSTGDRDLVLKIASHIYPLLCSRRKAQFDRCLAGLQPKKSPQKTIQPSVLCPDILPTDISSKGFQRHKRKGEFACANCLAANNNYQRSVAKNKKPRPTTYCEGVFQPLNL